MIPSPPAEAIDAEDEGELKEEILPSIKRVIEYSGLTFNEVLDLPTDLFMLMLKNHYVDELNKTEEGREYLEKCKRLNTTTIDKVKIRRKIKQNEVLNNG